MDKLFKLNLFVLVSLFSFSALAVTDLLKLDENFYRNFKNAKVGTIERAELIQTRNVLSHNVKGYRPKDNPFLQRFIDEATIRIFLTDYGLNFCLILAADKEAIQSQTAVSNDVATFLSKECRARLIEENLEIPQKARSKPMPREYLFAIGEHPKRPLKSWTTLTNHTFLMIDHATPPIEIYKSIIHELYIVFDHKAVLGSGQSNLVDTGRYNITTDELFSFNAASKLDKALGIVPYPLIRFNFAITRAQRVEDLIISDIFKHDGVELPIEKTNYLGSKKSCWELIDEQALSLLDYQVAFLPAHYVILTEAESKILAAGYYLTKEEYETKVAEIRNFKLLLVDKESKVARDFCQYMSEPLISDFGSFYSRGPKPRVKSGSTGSGQTQLYTEKYIQDDIQAEDIEIDSMPLFINRMENYLER